MSDLSFLNRALALYEQGRTDSGADVIYDGIDILMCRGDMESLNKAIDFAKKHPSQIDFGISVLSASIPCRKGRRFKRWTLKRLLSGELKKRGEDPRKELIGL